MFSALLKKLVEEPTNDQIISRRRHPRRPSDRCVCVINGMPYPVENWSLGGVLIRADGRLFSFSQHVELTMKFKVGNTVIDIPHRGHIIRKSNGKVAFQFEPLTKPVRQKFHNIIDNMVVTEFADSQAR